MEVWDMAGVNAARRLMVDQMHHVCGQALFSRNGRDSHSEHAANRRSALQLHGNRVCIFTTCFMLFSSRWTPARVDDSMLSASTAVPFAQPLRKLRSPLGCWRG